MAYFIPLNGPFRKPKWCFLQCEKLPLKRKLLVFSTLWKSLMIRVFAPEDNSVRKYSLIFRGRTGNSDRKIRIRLRFESATMSFMSQKHHVTDSFSAPSLTIEIHHSWISEELWFYYLSLFLFRRKYIFTIFACMNAESFALWWPSR